MIIRNIIQKAIIFSVLGLILFGCSTHNNHSLRRYYDLIQREQSSFVEIDTSRINELAIDHVIKGSMLQQQNKYAESVLEFQQALKYDSSASILFAMSKSYSNLGMYDMAFENVLKSLDKEPKFIPAMELLTNLYFIKRNIKDAIIVYKEIIQLEPSRNRKLYLARLYEFEDVNESIKLYEDLLGNNEDEKILLKVSELYHNNGDTVKLLSTYEKLIKYSSSKPLAYDLLLRTYIDKSQYNRALDLLDTIRLQFSQDDVNYFFNLTGNSLIDDSSEIAQKYIPSFLAKIDNDFYFDWRINMISGYLSDKINDSAEVNKFFERAMNADTVPDVILAISTYYSQHNLNGKALELLKTHETRFPGNHIFPLYKGMIYLETDSTNLALLEFRKTLDIDTNNMEAWGQLGYAYDRLKIYDSCDYAYNKVLAVQPDNSLINNNFAYSLSVRGENLEDALKMSAIALGQEPDNPSYLDTYGWIHYQLGKYETALEYILKAIDTGEVNAEVYEHLGYIYLKLNQKSKAIEAWETAISIGTDNDELLKQLRLLKEADD
ncbi:tetratricopeptide repeat protein [Bacteroidota bacterium]